MSTTPGKATAQDLKEMDKGDYVALMQKYIEATKSVVQLATASLILPLFFIRKILGVPEETDAEHVNENETPFVQN